MKAAVLPTHRVMRTLAEAEPTWRRLELEAPTFAFQSFDWVFEWYRSVGACEGVSPALVVVESADRVPWMLFPMGIRRGSLGRVLVWLGGELSDYLGPLIGPSCPESLLTRDFPSLWRSIVAGLPRFSYAHMERQPAIVSGRPNPMQQLDWRENPSRSHHTVLGSDWKTYYHAKSSSRTRQTDRRKQRRLEDNGAVVFEIATGPRALELLPTMFAQKSRSYRELGVEDLFADARHRDFVERLTLSATGAVHLSCLRIGDRILATHWGLVHQGRFYCLLPTYERSELTQHSPGALLRLRLLQWACENGVQVFDFTVGDEPYKEQWCEVSMPLFDGLLPGSAWGHVCTAALHAGSALKRKVKASPELFSALVRLRALGWGHGFVAAEKPERAEQGG